MKQTSKLLSGILTTAMLVSSVVVPGGIVMADDYVALDSAHFPDANFRAVLKEFDTNNSGGFDTEELKAVTEIHCDEKGINSLEGIKYFTELTGIYCKKNNLTSLDFSSNYTLWDVECSDNQITSINVSKNSVLSLLRCDGNQLKSLNLKNNPELLQLNCSGNQLTSLDLSGNPNLTDLYCNKNSFTTLNISNNPNLVRLACTNNGLTSIDTSNNIALVTLNVGNNKLTSLDISSNINLLNLFCENNSLTKLNTDGINLSLLDCTGNQITSLDLHYNTQLGTLNCGSNKLSSIDLSNNNALKTLDISNNNISNLNVSEISTLMNLYCQNNNLSVLDISANKKLQRLNCANNSISELDLKAHRVMVQIDCSNNKMTQLDINDCSNLLIIATSGNKITKLNMNSTDFPDLDLLAKKSSGTTIITETKEAIANGNSSTYTLANGTEVQYGSYLLVVDSTTSTVGISFTYDKPTATPKPTTKPTTAPSKTPTKAPGTNPTTAPGTNPTTAPSGGDSGNGGSTTPTNPTTAPNGGNNNGGTTGGNNNGGSTTNPTSAPNSGNTTNPTTAPNGGNGSTNGGASNGGSTGSNNGSSNNNSGSTAKPTTKPNGGNGSEATKAGTVEDFAERLYTTCLGRDAEQAGKDYWVGELKGGKPGSEVAEGFFFSPEFIGFNLDDAEYITRLYRTFMGREPDKAGIDYWSSEMKSGKDRKYVFDGFVNSTEWANICLTYGIRSGGLASPTFEKEASPAVKAFAERLYTTCLGREAEKEGLEWWAAELANLRQTGTVAASGFFNSPEFIGLKTDDNEYVTRLYKTFMGRDPEEAGFKYWTGELKSGKDRQYVFDGFSAAPEFANLCADAGIMR